MSLSFRIPSRSFGIHSWHLLQIDSHFAQHCKCGEPAGKLPDFPLSTISCKLYVPKFARPQSCTRVWFEEQQVLQEEHRTKGAALLSRQQRMLPALLECGTPGAICLQTALEWPSTATTLPAHRCRSEPSPGVGLWSGGGPSSTRLPAGVVSPQPASPALLARCLVLILALFFPRWLQLGCFQFNLARMLWLY